jgi:cytochrome c-type biogenesis protein CcmH/NrfG
MRQIKSLRPEICIIAFLVLQSSVMGQDPSGRPAPRPKKQPAAREKEKPKPSPQPITITLTVITDPPGCDVYINGEKRATTDGSGRAQLSGLPLGRYTVAVAKEDYAMESREFEAGPDPPTLVFRLAPDLSRVVKEFESLINAGNLLGPSSPNAYELLKQTASKFPDRPEVEQMRTSLLDQLLKSVKPIINRTANQWRMVSRQELILAVNAAAAAATIKADDPRASSRAAYLRGVLALRDWMTAETPTGDESGGNLHVALAELQKATKFDDSWAAAWYQLGRARLLFGEMAAAQSDFAKAAQLDPAWAAPQAALGEAYYNLGRNKEAISAYQRAIQIDPNYAPAHAGLGLARASASGKPGDGLRDIQRAIEIDPASALPHFYLGIAYSKSKNSKDWSRAEESLKKAISMNPQNLEFQNQIAQQLLATLESRRKKK